MLDTFSYSSRRGGDQYGTVRVLVADSQPLYRDALVRAMERERAIVLTHATDRIAGLGSAVARHRPDVVVAGRELLGGDLSELIAALHGGARLLLLAGDVAPED